MNITLIDISQIKPYPGNPRINDKAIDQVAASLKAYGFRQPIVVDKNNVVIVGHTRLAAAQSIGMTQVPVTVATGLTQRQIAAYRIADNKTGEFSEWDDALLRDELLELQSGDFSLEETGFTTTEIDKMLNNHPPDDFPEYDASIATEHTCPGCGYEWS